MRKIISVVVGLVLFILVFASPSAQDQPEIHRVSKHLTSAINFRANSAPNNELLRKQFVSDDVMIKDLSVGKQFSIAEFSKFLANEYPGGIKIAEFGNKTSIWFGLRAYRTSYVNPTGKGGIYDDPSKEIRTKLKKVDGQWLIYEMEIDDYKGA